MKRWSVLLLVTIILTFPTISIVAATGDPVGACPNSFHLHEAMDHDHSHNGQHKHVGNDRDLNDDGWICGKHVGANDAVHVHIDNNLPLP